MNLPNQIPDKLAVLRVTSLLLLVLMSFVLQRPVLLVAGAFICAIYAFIHFKAAKIRNDEFLLFLAICVLFLPAFFKPYHGLSAPFYFFSTMAAFFAAKAITRHPPEVFLIAFRLIFAAAVVVIAWALYTYWGDPEPLGEVIEGSSTNGIPAYLIVIQIGLSISNYLVFRKLPLLSPLITGVVAIFGYGRGSLVVAGMIIALSLIFNLTRFPESQLRKIIFFFFLAVVAIGFVYYSADIIEFFTNYTKLGVGLVDSNRKEIWDQYMSKINPWTLLVGADYEGTVIEYQYAGNPHISFIRAHSLFGLPVTIIALISPAFVFFSRKTISSKLVVGSLIAMAAMRAASEPILFPTLLDFFYFSYFFLFFRYASNSSALRKNGTHRFVNA